MMSGATPSLSTINVRAIGQRRNLQCGTCDQTALAIGDCCQEPAKSSASTRAAMCLTKTGRSALGGQRQVSFTTSRRYSKAEPVAVRLADGVLERVKGIEPNV
jgi:hypothetical protein